MRKLLFAAAISLAGIAGAHAQQAACDPDQLKSVYAHYQASELDKVVMQKALSSMTAEVASLKRQIEELKKKSVPAPANFSKPGKAHSGGK